MCEEGEEVPLHPMGIVQSVSQEPSGKQNQDTGDLFFMSTSLTRYPLQVLLMWILKSDISSSSSGWRSCPIWYWWHRQDLRQLKKLHLIECKYETCRFFQSHWVQLEHCVEQGANTAVGKAAVWSRTEIVNILPSLTCLVALPRA